MFPVQQLSCRSAGCGRVRNRARHRDSAPRRKSCSKTPSATSEGSRSSPPLPFPPGRRARRPPPLPSQTSPSPFVSSWSPPRLPPAASSSAASTPCSHRRTPSCPGSDGRLGARGRRRAAACPREISATWTRHMWAGQGSGSSLAELVRLLTKLVVNNE